MGIEDMIAIVVGILVFIYMFLIKVPVKKLHSMIAKQFGRDNATKAYAIYRYLNFTLIIWTTIFSVVLYYIICVVLNIHHKLCCSFKAAVIALCMYAVYQQIWKNTSHSQEV